MEGQLVAVRVKTKSKSNGSKTLTKSEKLKLKAKPSCIAPGADNCPAVSGTTSPYMYQKGCRGEACSKANAAYYKKWRDARAKAAEKKRAKRRAQAKAKREGPATQKRKVATK